MSRQNSHSCQQSQQDLSNSTIWTVFIDVHSRSSHCLYFYFVDSVFPPSHSLQLLGDLSEQPMRQKLLFSHPTEEGTGKVARCQVRKENWRTFLDPVPVLLQDKNDGACGGHHALWGGQVAGFGSSRLKARGRAVRCQKSMAPGGGMAQMTASHQLFARRDPKAQGDIFVTRQLLLPLVITGTCGLFPCNHSQL